MLYVSSRRRATVSLAVVGALLSGTVLSACGEDEPTTEEQVTASAPSAKVFPAAKGQTLQGISQVATVTEDIVVAPAGAVYTPGENRVGFGVFTAGQEQITNAEVALYAGLGDNGTAVGPFPARIESLETDPAFEARTTADDPASAKAVYVSEVEFDQPGEWQVIAMINQDDELLVTRFLGGSSVVDDYEEIPAVGDKAPAVHTPTVAEVPDLGEIDTRNPHDTMHELDAADTIGKRPTVLLFATPALCASRVCGPVVDAAEQVKSEMGDDAAFVHMEVFRNNNPTEPVRPQLDAFGLQTEPWLFVLDAKGKVSTRIEGAFSVDELRDAVEKAT